MEGLFLGYLKIGFWTAFLIGGALLLLPRLSGRYSAKLPYAVWLVLALRLLCPWGLPVPEEAVPVRLEMQEAGRMAPWDEDFWAASQTGAALPAATPKAAAVQAGHPADVKMPAPLACLAAVWLAGAAILAARFAWHSFRLARMLGRWGKLPDGQTGQLYAALAGEKRPPLRVCAALDSPMAAGLLAPKIYIPHEDYSGDELEMILRHELIHCKRRDIWYKLLLFTAKCLHWYNPLVHLLVRQAHKDLEISCDAEAVRGRDAAYRKAYGQMILREAERGAQPCQGLNTCFAAGKKTLKARLREILDGGARRRGLPLLAVSLLLAAGAGCAVKEAAGEPEGAPVADGTVQELELPLDKGETETLEAMAADWAEALSLKDGKIRYEMMSEGMQEQFVEGQIAVQGEDWDYYIGGSSPWPNSYEITVTGDKATIDYDMQDSGQHYGMLEILKFGKAGGKIVVTHDTCSNLRMDGQPYQTLYPTYFIDSTAADPGVLDFMRESVFDIFRQGKFRVYELEEFAFDIQDVRKERLANGNDEVTVDFELTVKYRNPFRDPDEAGYIQDAKAQGRAEYDTLYREYYQQQEAADYYRFICQTAPGAEDVTEETCDPETFRLYCNDPLPFATEYSFYDKISAAEGMLWDAWKLCGISKMKSENAVLVDPQLRVQDWSGRTENGYFILNLDMAEGFGVAADAEITIRDGNRMRTASRGEWMEMLKQAGNNTGKSYAVETRQDGNETVISKVTEVAR